MLDMFKRPTDPPEYNQLFAIPGAAMLATYAAGHFTGARRAASVACWATTGWPPSLRPACAARGLRIAECRPLSNAHPLPAPTGHPEMESLAYLGSGGLCIAAIACLANQNVRAGLPQNTAAAT